MVDICRYLDIYRYLDIVAAFCQVFGFEVDRAHYPEATGDCAMVRVGHSLMCSQYSAIIKLPAINTSQLLTRPGLLGSNTGKTSRKNINEFWLSQKQVCTDYTMHPFTMLQITALSC